ncbi:MAG: M28 family metallopeptidase [Microbacter sp.]
MKRFKLIAIGFFYFGLMMSTPLYAQNEQADPTIVNMLSEVQAARLEATVNKLVSFGTRHALSDTCSDVRGIGAAQRWVKSQFDEYAKESNGRLKSEMDWFTVKADNKRILKDVKMANVMAVLNGSDSHDDRVLIVSGHLDSRATDILDAKSDAPGADDDGSGVAAVLELARIMSRHVFPCKIIFAVVSGEEEGLYGSTYLADSAKKANWNVIAMLNDDMIANSLSSGTALRDNSRVRVFSETIPYVESPEQAKMRKTTGAENDSPSRELARYIQTTTHQYVPNLHVNLVYRVDRFLRGGDQIPFMHNGFTAVRLCEMDENFDHQHQNVRFENGVEYGDLPKFLDYEYARKITCANLATLCNLAWAPYAPSNVVIEVKDLTNSSTLSWEKPSKAPYGYQLLLRETSSPQWQKAIFTKNTDITVPYSKDNYFFAVQSVDSLGHASIPVFPSVQR